MASRSDPSTAADDANAPEAPAPLEREHLLGAFRVIALEPSPAEIDQMLPTVARQGAAHRALRAVPLPEDVPPALRFEPRDHRGGPVRPPFAPAGADEDARSAADAPERPEDLDFASAARLGTLLRAGRVTARELAERSLARLERFGPELACVVERLEPRALAAAERADAELAAGRDRGPLHGIPVGLKDLLDVPGAPTTWGAAPYRSRVGPGLAAVVERLEAAGAVPVAKLSLGALAMGDVWFGGTTRNPWEPERGSSGSSAGSAAAVAAGLVPLAIGSETLGSIVSPSARCAVAGLRPTFGRVSRRGAMALAWSMDKLGPMARSVADLGAAFDAIRGRDPGDPSTVDAPFAAPGASVEGMRIGWLRSAFEDAPEGAAPHHAAVLAALEARGATLVPLELPPFPGEPFVEVLMAEAATAFDDLVREDRDDELTDQGDDAWPNLLRAARLLPAVEYLRANRLRALAVRAVEDLFRGEEGVDAYLCPAGSSPNLVLTNATGHPAAVLPHAWEGGRPVPDAAMTVTAALDREDAALRVARAIEADLPPRGRPAGFGG